MRTADGTVHTSIAAVKIQIKFNNKEEEMEMLVVPSLTNNLILGMDFWDRFNIKPVICEIINTENTFENSLSSSEKELLRKTIASFPTCGEKELTRTKVLCHEIDTGSAKPVRQRYHPVSPYIQCSMDKELQRMLDMGVIEPSESAWASPIVGVKKANGDMRLCLDARKLNDVSKKKGYPLPYISRILGRLKGTKYLSSIDLKNSFWQIPLEPSAKEKTAFTVPGRGHYQFTVMPFGLCNAAQTQSQLMDLVLGFDMEPFVFNYIDDIICATSTFEDHIHYLNKISEKLRSANLSINVEKSKFCVPEIKYLGYVLTKDGIGTNPEKISAIINYPSPKTVKEIRQLIGMASWYRRFIKGFSEITVPITSLIRKAGKFIWNSEAENALNILKTALTSAPILSTPDFSKEFTIQTDASDSGMGAVITQIFDEEERVIEYMSQKFTDAQKKYTTTEKECLALILAMEKFRPYIEGVKFRAITDHASLLWLRNLKDPSGRLARWSLRMQAYEFDLIHRKGKCNDLPDALSRNIAAIQLCDTSFETDPWYSNLRTQIIEKPEEFSGFKVDGLLVYKYVSRKDGSDFDWKLVVPESLRQQILKECHDLPFSSHGGAAKTISRTKLRYFWPSMTKEIKNYVKVCEICQTTKYPHITLRHEMGAQKQVTKPWEMVSVDLIGKLPRSKSGFAYLIVMIDVFTKYVLVKPIRTATTKAILSFLEENFMMFSVPRVVTSDNGSQFISKEYKKFLEDYNISPWYTASYHAQANSVERSNRVIKTAIRAYIDENHREWDLNIQKIAYAIRSVVHSSTKHSPYFLNFGQEMVVNGEFHRLDEKLKDLSANKTDRLEQLETMRQNVQENLRNAYLKYSQYYNLRSRKIQFKKGDIVLKREFRLSDAIKGYTAGLGKTFIKCIVMEKLGTSCYRLKNMEGKDIGVFNIKDLQEFHK